eukprot:297841-Rhodomonas_salina.2
MLLALLSSADSTEPVAHPFDFDDHSPDLLHFRYKECLASAESEQDCEEGASGLALFRSFRLRCLKPTACYPKSCLDVVPTAKALPPVSLRAYPPGPPSGCCYAATRCAVLTQRMVLPQATRCPVLTSRMRMPTAYDAATLQADTPLQCDPSMPTRGLRHVRY